MHAGSSPNHWHNEHNKHGEVVLTSSQSSQRGRPDILAQPPRTAPRCRVMGVALATSFCTSTAPLLVILRKHSAVAESTAPARHKPMDPATSRRVAWVGQASLQDAVAGWMASLNTAQGQTHVSARFCYGIRRHRRRPYPVILRKRSAVAESTAPARHKPMNPATSRRVTWVGQASLQDAVAGWMASLNTAQGQTHVSARVCYGIRWHRRRPYPVILRKRSAVAESTAPTRHKPMDPATSRRVTVVESMSCILRTGSVTGRRVTVMGGTQATVASKAQAAVFVSAQGRLARGL